jgi:DNA-binding MarR family transcriptional regulator
MMETSQCTCFNLRKASRSVTQMFAGYMQPTGLGPTQFSLLAILSRRGSLSINQLADLLVMDRTTLTRNLKPVQRQGLVKIAPGEDRRTRIVTLTPRGRATYEMALPLWREAQKEIVRRLGGKRWSALLTDLSAAIDAAHAA